MKKNNNDNFYTDNIQEEIDKYSNKCFDVLKHNERIQKFKEIYKEEFWVEISDKEALEYSTILFNFVKLVVYLKNK